MGASVCGLDFDRIRTLRTVRSGLVSQAAAVRAQPVVRKRQMTFAAPAMA